MQDWGLELSSAFLITMSAFRGRAKDHSCCGGAAMLIDICVLDHELRFEDQPWTDIDEHSLLGAPAIGSGCARTSDRSVNIDLRIATSKFR